MAKAVHTGASIKRFHILLNVAVGGDWGGQQGIDDSIFPAKMEADHVRVYKMIDK